MDAAGKRRAILRARRRARMRGLTSVEIAAAVAVIGSLAAVAVPTFVRNLHASHWVEATDGLARIGAGTSACVKATGAMPPPAPLTPSAVPRGERVVDPPGTWDAPGWRAIDFRAAPEGMAHRYSFETESAPRDGEGPSGGGPADLVARAHGDLDGDGVTSTFEVRVRRTDGPTGPDAALTPGMRVEQELE